MPAYTYKNSGIAWLGEVPEHWRETGLKNLFTVKPSNVDKRINEEEQEVKLCNYVDVYYNDFITSDLNFMDGSANEHEINKFQLEVGDVIITKDSEDPSDIGIPTLVKETFTNLVCGYHLSMLRPRKKDIKGDYLFWLLKDYSIASQLFREATGVTRWAIASRHIKSVKLPLPPLPEQKSIASYLEKACAKIDRVIAIKQEQLQKMEGYWGRKVDETIVNGLENFDKKDSRKDFIGKIPKHYKVVKLKHICIQVTDGAHFTPNYIHSPLKKDIPFLRVTDIQTEKINLDRTKFIELAEHIELSKRCHPEKGDLLLSKNGTIGITKVVDWEYEFSIFVSLCLIKPTEFLNPFYLNYYFKSDIMKYQLANGSKQITVTNLHLDKIREFYIVLPPLKEQIQLVEILKTLEKKTETLKTKLTTQITTLKAYRKSLIHECVTGKKQVFEGKKIAV
jgi:type I restriction enzyme S subunit